MRTRRFGETDLQCSEIGFGTWALGSDWWGDHESPDSLVARALDLGITFFDTGDTYGQGFNEELVGEALARSGRPRDAYELSTKFGYVLDADRKAHKESERPHDWSPAHTRRALEASLRRLRTDHVDLYQLHNPRMDGIAGAAADELFVEALAVRVARVEEGDAEVERARDERVGGLVVAPPVRAQRPRAKADRRGLELRVAEGATPHRARV